jgi:hypothetical protein
LPLKIAVLAASCLAAAALFLDAHEAGARDGRGGGAFGFGGPPGSGFGGPRLGGGMASPRLGGPTVPGLGSGRIGGGMPSLGAAPPRAAPRLGPPSPFRSFGTQQFGARPLGPGLGAYPRGVAQSPQRYGLEGPRFRGNRLQAPRTPNYARNYRPDRLGELPGAGRAPYSRPPAQRNLRGAPGQQSARNSVPALPRSQGRLGDHRSFAGNPALRNERVREQTLAPLNRLRPRNDAAFKRGNAFETSALGGRRWRGREGRFRRFWAGPVFWPYFVGDTFSYAVWPYTYSSAFWSYGPDAILWGAWPLAAYGEDLGPAAAYEGEVEGGYEGGARNGRRARRGGAAGGEQRAALCSGFAPGVTDLPIERLERILRPAAEQRAALDDLKAAFAKASRILESACPDNTPATPVARLDAMEQRFAAMQQAIAVVRGPLERVYALLNDAQVERLENSAASKNGERSPALDVAALCSTQSGLSNVPADEIVRAVDLTDEQRFDLDKLKRASGRAADVLKASCPSGAPRSLHERLEAAQKRIAALIHAIETLRPAAGAFYASLSEQQKAALLPQERQAGRTARR